MDTPVGLPLLLSPACGTPPILLSSRLPDFLPSYCPLPLAEGRWCVSTKGGWARRSKGFPPHPIVPPPAGARWCVSTKGGRAFGPEGCIEGLCPQRGNDSLHFARRFAPSSTAVTDSLDFQVADAPLQIQFASAKCVRCASLRSGGDSPTGLKVVDCPLGNDYEVSVTGLAFVSLCPRHFERRYKPV